MALLCEPYLLDPEPRGVRVVWHTDEPGSHQVVLAGTGVPALTAAAARAAAIGTDGAGPGWRRFSAATTRLRRMREDGSSAVPGRRYDRVFPRPVHRQLAAVDGLPPGRTPYRVVSIDSAGMATVTQTYTFAPALPPGAPARLLLTSDHQLKPMVPVNLAKVAETVGVELDGVLMAGDMVNVPDRASDWFDSGVAPAFFAAFAGRAGTSGGEPCGGAPILQHTPIFPAIGNHEVMGGWSPGVPLLQQFHGAQPERWNITTYTELFPVPASPAGGPRWWSRTIGEVHVIALFVTHAWRPPGESGRTKYREATEDLDHPDRWGYGQFLFEPVHRDSAQYRWLRRELASPAALAARFRVVMFHHPGHGLGDHSVPPYTDPVPSVTRDPATGAITGVSYQYPLADDHILRDLAPLFDEAGVHLVLNGHSHLWNRFRSPAGVNWLETSNVGNSYGAYDRSSGRKRDAPPGYLRQGDPGGLTPAVPTLAPLTGTDGLPLPFVASDHITVFSILDSAAGVVRSYRFDTREPAGQVLLFDEFPLD